MVARAVFCVLNSSLPILGITEVKLKISVMNLQILGPDSSLKCISASVAAEFYPLSREEFPQHGKSLHVVNGCFCQI